MTENVYGQKFIPIPNETDKLNGIQMTVWAFAWLALILDVMDWLLVSVSATSILAEFHMPKTQMGLILGAPLLGAGVGGLLSGWLSDKFGRVRVMVYCLIWYSAFTVLFAFSNSYHMMLVLRILVGIGLGAQWGVGNVLVAEIMPARLRITCSAVIQTGFAFGPFIAAFLAKMILPGYGWRPLFYFGAIGFVMAVVAKIWIPEPEAWLRKRHEAKTSNIQLGNIPQLFSPELRARTVCVFILLVFTIFAYWGAMSWIPTWLVTDRGMNIVKSMNYLMWLNLGGIVGFIAFAFIADRWGRKPPAYVTLLACTVAIWVFVSITNPTSMLLYAPVYAFITYPIFGLFGGYLSELFPTEVRATAVNGLYNLARLTAFWAPAIMGAIASATSMTTAIGLTALLYGASVIPLWFLPETRQKRQARIGVQTEAVASK
jgi:AAHS family cis,cis-muconate transporter-like MFS transporter